MSSREQRIAANEALFRDVNERIARSAPDSADGLDIICECGDRECLERITVTTAEYEHARSDPTLFLAVPGHFDRAAEEVRHSLPVHIPLHERRGSARRIVAIAFSSTSTT